MATYTFKNRFMNDGESLARILNSTREQILTEAQRKKTSYSIKDIQSNLQEIFYGNNSDIAKGYAEEIEYKKSVCTHTIIDILQSFDGEQVSQRGDKDTRKTFESTTLLNAITAAIKSLDRAREELQSFIKNSNVSQPELEIKLREIKAKIAEAEEIYKSGEFAKFGNTNKLRYTGKDAANVLSIINYLEGFTKIMNSPQELTPQEAGDIFERWLEKAGPAFRKSALKNLLEEEFSSKKTGQKSIPRGVNGGDLQVSYQMNFKLDSDLFGKDDDSSVKLDVKEKNLSITYNPGRAAEGKADVVFTWPEDYSNNFRFSAKRWSHGSGDLGFTSIDAGIIRAGGISVAEAYKLAVLQYDDPQAGLANAAHQFAKVALASDIAMGLNQGIQYGGYGYANLLIIDYSDKQHISVQDLTEIVENISNGDKLISGYNEGTIENSAKENYLHIKNKTLNRSDRYLGLMTSSLNKMKVTIYHSVIRN